MERFEAGRVGYDILSEGEVGLRSLFAEFQRSFHAEASTSGLVSTFGRIYVLVSQGDNSAYGPLRDVLRKHIVETMPFGPGDNVLGQKVTERRMHSVRTVAFDLGLSFKTAHQRLRFIGVLDAASGELSEGRSTFDARVHANDIRRLANSLQRAEAGRYLGLKRVYEDVAPILDVMVGSMNMDKSNLIDQVFAKEDLDAFLASILEKAQGPIEPGFEPIAKASKRVRVSIANILDMILKGAIKDVRISPSHKGVMSVMVRKADILSVTLARRTWITLTDGAKAIGMAEPTLTILVKSKIIPSKGASPLMLELDDLMAFKDTYVSRWEVAHKYRALRGPANRFSMTEAIALVGLKPAFSEKRTPYKFYRRDAVSAAFGPPPT